MGREATTLRAGDRVRVALLVAVALLAVRNVGGWLFLPDWAYVPVNLAVAGGLGALAWWAGLSQAEVGLDPSRAGAGLRFGLVVLAIVVVVVGTAALVPAAETLFDDDRARVSTGGMLFHTLVRIPLGTVVLEELAFRGVLLALLLRLVRPLAAVGASSLLFGLWHVMPSLGLGDRNGALPAIDGALDVAGIVAAAVVATAIAGVAFCWLRLRSGSLLAPVIAHVATNSVAFLAAWLVMRSG